MRQGLALFDFDGTITRKDSMLEFLKYAVGKFRYVTTMVLFTPVILYHIFIKKNGENAKRMVISFLFKGKSREHLNGLGKSFVREVIPGLLIPRAMEEINKHKKQGDRVVVISASLDIWLEPWALEHNIELLCTKLEFGAEKFTGHFATANCNGVEKVNRISGHLDIGQYHPVYAYGNSSGDKPMLELADYGYLRRFNCSGNH